MPTTSVNGPCPFKFNFTACRIDLGRNDITLRITYLGPGLLAESQSQHVDADAAGVATGGSGFTAGAATGGSGLVTDTLQVELP